VRPVTVPNVATATFNRIVFVCVQGSGECFVRCVGAIAEILAMTINAGEGVWCAHSAAASVGPQTTCQGGESQDVRAAAFSGVEG
jgi:hypothetical protein